MATRVGTALLSALRRTGSATSLGEITPELLPDTDERNALLWLKEHVSTHGSFPTPGLFREHTGLATVATTQSLTFYIAEAVKQAQYNASMPLFGDLQDAMRSQNVGLVLERAKQISRLEQAYNPRSTGHVTLDAALGLVEADYIESRQLGDTLRGVPSGWDYVDQQTGGWMNGELVSFVGRPGRGKTYILLYQAYNAWLSGKKVLFVSMELAALQLARRIVGIHTRINPDFIRKGRISNSAHDGFIDSMHTMRGGIGFDIIVGGFNKSVEAVQAFAQETQPDIIFIDASYLLHSEKRKSGNQRRENAADTIEGLKQTSLDLNRPIIQSVQFNRHATKPKRDEDQDERQNPLSHLSLEKIGETDTIGQASSYVFGIDLYDPPFQDSRRWMGFLKGREGENGVFAINYAFTPVDFSLLHTGYGRQADAQQAAGVDVSHMLDQEV
jgi:replicative DNA helicase